MKRRDLFKWALAAPAAFWLPQQPALAARAERKPLEGGRVFELTYQIEIAPAEGKTRLWLPLPDNVNTDYQRWLSTRWSGSPDHAGFRTDPVYGAGLFYAEWNGAETPRTLEVTSRVSTRDRNLSKGGFDANSNFYLKPTRSMPIDGIVAATSKQICGQERNPEKRVRMVYDWIVENTFRDPKVQGCGVGDIKFMLEAGQLSGKCADLNALFVGLARAAGIPAREMYGIRVADSTVFKSLGKSGEISKAQHCRAECYLPEYGWVAVDPADVRKAVLEEKLDLADARIKALRERLFGNWEMNWLAFNTARDFDLSPAASKPLGFLMYPHAEIAGNELNQLDPAKFKYRILSREIVAA